MSVGGCFNDPNDCVMYLNQELVDSNCCLAVIISSIHACRGPLEHGIGEEVVSMVAALWLPSSGAWAVCNSSAERCKKQLLVSVAVLVNR